MILLGLDFESSGLQIGSIGITEVGMVKWDTDLCAPIQMTGYLVDPGPEVTWEPGVEKINGLTPQICDKYGMPDERAARTMLSWYQSSDIAVAHNGLEFDKPLLQWWAQKYKLDDQPGKLWIDTKCDIEIPARNSSRLVYMAADHGFLNPFPHRAMFDVMTMMTILSRYDLDKVIETAKSPKLTIRAMVEYADRELAKQRGYHWHADTKMWLMSVKECNLEKEKAAADFAITVLA